MFKAAIVGCGDVSIVYAEAIAALGAEIVAVADLDHAAALKLAQKTQATAYSSLQELLAQETIDVLHITTPHDQHIDLALMALKAGVHVLVENPLANELDQAQRLLDYLKENPQAPKIGVCFQNRYNVSSVELRRPLEEGELGEIRGAYASVVWTRTSDYYSAKPWRGQQIRSGGGLLMNQAIHTLDLLQWFLGPVTKVRGEVSTDKYGEIIDVEDSAHAFFTHESGISSSFYGTLANSRHRSVEIELDWENALVKLKDGLTVTWINRAESQVEHYPERTQNSAGRTYWGVSHELLIRDFYGHLDSAKPFWIGPQEALASPRMAKALY